MNDIVQSRRFISSLVGMILMLVVSAWPELQPYQEQLTTAITAIVVALIAGYSLEDMVTALRSNLGKIITAVEDVAEVVEQGVAAK